MAAPSAPSRRTMYGLMAGTQFANYVTRSGASSLIQILCKDLRFFTDDQKALLLAAHTPGYSLTQIPAGMLTGRWGAKFLLFLNLFGSGCALLLAPTIAQAGAQRGVAWPLAVTFSAMGLFHGPMIPCQVRP